MFKNTFLFITAFLAATSASNGYGSTDSLKGNVNAATFLDWFSNAERYLHVNGLIALDFIPLLFLIIQTVLFYKDGKKVKGLFAGLALLANLIGVFLVMQYAYPIAAQMTAWTPDNVPSDWILLKDEWINYVGLHGLLGMFGWLCFVITFFVSETGNEAVKRLPRFLNFSKKALAFFLTFMLGLGAARLYEFCFFPFQYEISGTTFIEMHRPLDLAMRKVGPILFPFIVTLLLMLATLFFVERSKKKAWLILAALLFLIADTFIALNYNRPLNDLFLTWTSTTLPANWSVLRDQWLGYHLYRNIFMTLMIGCILLIYFVREKKSVAHAV